MNITKLISTAKDSATRLIVKVRRLGLNDVQTAYNVAPWGYDSNPEVNKKYVPVFEKTGVKGDTVLVGYIQQGMLTEPGQVRIFQVTSEGAIGAAIWLRGNNIELGGNSHNAVRFTPLEVATDKLALDLNTELAKIQVAIASLGGAYTPASIDISIGGAKVDNVKTG